MDSVNDIVQKKPKQLELPIRPTENTFERKIRGRLHERKHGEPRPIPLRKLVKYQEKEFTEPLVIIWRTLSNYDFEIWENAVSGSMARFIASNGRLVEVIVDTRKVGTFHTTQGVIRAWLIDERNAVCLPEEPEHDAFIFKDIIESIRAGKEDLVGDDQKRILNLLILGGGLLALLWLASIIGIDDWIFDLLGMNTPPPATTATQETGKTIINQLP